MRATSLTQRGPVRQAPRISRRGRCSERTRPQKCCLDTVEGGALQGTVATTFDNDLKPVSLSVNGAAATAFGYDNDGLLTHAGAITVGRHAQTGDATSTTLGTFTTTATYDAFGDIASFATAGSGAGLYSQSITRDALGRVDTRADTIGGQTTTYDYSYDDAGRLTDVSRGGVPVEAYVYDGNGNRTESTVGGQSVTATYDAQDRLEQHGNRTFTYRPSGELTSITAAGGAQTAFDYDGLGGLRSVELADGREIEYVLDATGRRIGRRLDGTLTDGWLYNGPQVVAELNGDGSIRSRFVYATRTTVPDYIVRDGVSYRIVTDHLGSPRLVVDAATGTVAQRIDYDTFGRVSADTNPGFQPFGYAGGLYDPDTGLVRFGARDYDPTTGRWTAKDPIGFAGGDTNLYGYVANDPVNWIDPSGLCGIDLAVDIAATGYSLYKAIRGCGSATEIGLNAAGALVPCAAGLGTVARLGAGKGGRELATGRHLSDSWHQATFPNKTQTVAYHWRKHAVSLGKSPSQYTQDALSFFHQNKALAQHVILKDGSAGLRIKTKAGAGGYFTPDGIVVSFWYR